MKLKTYTYPLLPALLILFGIYYISKPYAPQVSIIWNFHQPAYTQTTEGNVVQPWVRLRTLKDYYPKVYKADALGVPVTFNITASLLEQMQAYADGARDTVYALSEKDPRLLTEEEKAYILLNFFELKRPVFLEPFPRYRELLKKRGASPWNPTDEELENALTTFTPRDFRDLQTWYNLAWIDETLRGDLEHLVQKGSDFTEEEKRLVLKKYDEIIPETIPLFRRVFQKGVIEFSTSPMYWAVLPLIPREDQTAQTNLALEYFKKTFGAYPRGFIPSEGAVSNDVMQTLAENEHIQWIALDERTLKSGDPFIPYASNGKSILFRDNGLSDFFFSAHRLPPDVAVEELKAAIETKTGGLPSLAVFVTDGENPWDSYKDNGNALLDALYTSGISFTTPQDFLSRRTTKKEVSSFPTSSWMGDLETWTGEEEEDLAWEYLGETRDFIQKRGLAPETQESFLKAQGGDWFWYLGADKEYENDEAMKNIFRTHLHNVYRNLNEAPPLFPL